MTLEAERNPSGAETPPPDVVVADLAAVDRMLGYGAETLRRCYQCGTCSVVCPRTPLEDAFPRKEMVWAQWGLEDKLLTDADAWLCFQCNDCITHCPVDARPGDVMAATRDLQMEEYAVPRFMTRIPRDPKALPLAIAIPAVLVGLMVLGSQTFAGGDGVFPEGEVLFGHFLGEGWVDTFVMTVVIVIGALSFLSLRKFWAGLQSTVPGRYARDFPLLNALRSTAVDVFSHKDFGDCNTAHPRMWAHLGLFYGFLGLTAATSGAFIYTQVFPRIGIDHHGGAAVPADLGPGQDRRQRRRRGAPGRSGADAVGPAEAAPAVGQVRLLGLVLLRPPRPDRRHRVRHRDPALCPGPHRRLHRLRRPPGLHLRALRLLPVLQVLARSCTGRRR